MKYLFSAFFDPDFKETRKWANVVWLVAGIGIWVVIITLFMYRIGIFELINILLGSH